MWYADLFYTPATEKNKRTQGNMKHKEEIYCVQRKDYRKLIMGPLIPWYQTDQMNARARIIPLNIQANEWTSSC